MNWRVLRILLLTAASVSLTACFGDKGIDLSCDEPKFYEGARDGQRVKAPEGLDDLDEYREMPVPEAAPAPPRPAGSPCVDRPPNIFRTKN